MPATPADEVAAELWAIRRLVQRFKPGSHTDPHAFPEQILAVTERLDALHTRVRNTFGGTPTQTGPRTIVGPTGRPVTVEVRRTA